MSWRGIRLDEGRATVVENDQHQEELHDLEHHPGSRRYGSRNHGVIWLPCENGTLVSPINIHNIHS